MPPQGKAETEPSGARSPGRPFDHSADPQILAATLQVLVEHGYDRLTVDEVAARTGRAKTTLYRRWPTKLDLVVAAVGSVGEPPEAAVLPDTGSLRTDLLAVIDSPWLGGPERRLVLLGGLVAASRSATAIADAVRTTVTEPYGAVYERLLHRALDRGEVGPSAAGRIPLLARVIPVMSSQALELEGRPDRSFYVALVDDVVLPALGSV